jgi:hypothetical protein
VSAKIIQYAALGVISLLALGGWWWFKDPFRGVAGVEVDETIYYREAKPAFATPRRQRTLFIRGISGEKLLAQTKERYPEKDGWAYKTEGMPEGFRASKPAPGDELPETIVGFDALDGRYKLMELRVMTSAEVQVVRRAQGSDAFVMYPGAPIRRATPEGLDRTRFLTGF